MISRSAITGHFNVVVSRPQSAHWKKNDLKLNNCARLGAAEEAICNCGDSHRKESCKQVNFEKKLEEMRDKRGVLKNHVQIVDYLRLKINNSSMRTVRIGCAIPCGGCLKYVA